MGTENTSDEITDLSEDFFTDRSVGFDSALEHFTPGSRYSHYDYLFIASSGEEITRLEDYDRLDICVFQSLLQILRAFQDVDSERDYLLADGIKKFGAHVIGRDLKPLAMGQLTGYIGEIRKNELLKWFELELMNAQYKNGIQVISGLAISPGPPENILTPKILQHCLQVVCEFAKKNDFYVNFSLFWCAWLYKDRRTRKGSASAKKFLRTWIKTNPYHCALFQSIEQGDLLLHHHNDLMPTRDLFPIRREVCSRFYKPEPKEYLDEFWDIYKRYIRGLLSSLSFVNCSSKLTRLEKLYVKPLQFGPSKSAINNEDLVERAWRKYQAGKGSSDILKLEIDKVNLETEINILNSELSDLSRENTNLHILKKKDDHESSLENIQKEIDFKMWAEQKSVKKTYDALKEAATASQMQLISHHVSIGRPLIPLVVSGDAGKGKTIALSKFAHEYLMGIEEQFENSTIDEVPTLHLPFFFRAKHLSREINALPNSQHLVRELWNGLKFSIPEIAHHISREEFLLMHGRWMEFREQHNSSMVFFIDGLDECATRDSAKEILNRLFPQQAEFSSMFNSALFKEQFAARNHQKPVIILSTRPSHLEVVNEHLPLHALADMSVSEYHSEEELSHLMPLQLCDAWGITREPGKELHKMFKQYKETLIHPLFVGWFCFLILEQKLKEIETKSDNVHIRQNNLVSKIVEIGIQESLQRRESSHQDAEDTDGQSEFVDLLKTFVAVAFHHSIHRPDEIFTRMVEFEYCNELSASMKQSIMHDCGILYLTGESIEWTHSTVPELIYADFFHDRQRSFKLGSLRVTEPILLRLAQLDYEEGRSTSFDIALMRLYHRHDRQNFEEMRWDVWDEPGDSRRSYAPLLRMNKHGSPSVIPERSAEARELARMYLQFMNTPYRFGLYPDHFEEESRAALIEHVVRYSDNPFGFDLVHSDDNLVDHESISVDKVNSSTSVADCFRFYRELLKREPYEHISLDHKALTIHKRAGDYSGIFNLSHITRPLYLDTDYVVRTWIQDKQKKHNEWYKPRALLIDYITQEYLTTAYSQLFGSMENAKRCINLIYVELCDYEYTEYYEDMEETHHLLSWLFEKEHVGDSWPEGFDQSDVMVRGFLLIPFVNLCIEFLNGQENIIRDLSDWTHMSIWPPFEIVKQHAPNLER